MMTEEQLTVGIGNDKAKAEILSGYNAAKQALERGDAKALFALYEKASEQRGACLKAIEVIFEHGKRKESYGDAQSDENSIAALKEVALEALALAKMLAGKGEK